MNQGQADCQRPSRSTTLRQCPPYNPEVLPHCILAMPTFSRSTLGRYYGRPFHLFADAAKVLAAAHLFWAYGYDWGRVSGPSMLPGWSVWGEGAVISHLYRRGRGIQVGDLVRFKIPINDEVAIKRVLGLPGDYVMMNTPESGSDAMIQVREVRELNCGAGLLTMVVQVPQGHVWLIGDNLPASRDSRLYGPVPMALIDGKVIARTGSWPWQLHTITNPLEAGQRP